MRSKIKIVFTGIYVLSPIIILCAVSCLALQGNRNQRIPGDETVNEKKAPASHFENALFPVPSPGSRNLFI